MQCQRPERRDRPRGQLVEHPGFKVAARCDELALRLYAKLTEGQDGLLGDLAAACRWVRED